MTGFLSRRKLYISVYVLYVYECVCATILWTLDKLPTMLELCIFLFMRTLFQVFEYVGQPVKYRYSARQ